MNAKRRKLQRPAAKDLITDFLSMNNDCIYKIFEWLDLDDICSISETCKMLKILSSDYFQRKYNNKLVNGMRIIAVNGKIELQPNERCVWSFSRCFDSVIVNVNSTWSYNVDVRKMDLPLFIRENCNEYLSKIQFQSMFLYHSIGDSIANILENVENVVFSACDIESTYHQILKHCQNLKYLSVEESYGNKIDELLLEKYPKLEHFNCTYYGRVLLTNNLKIFLQQHPNLKRLTWCFHARILETTFSDKTHECIEIIVKNGKNLEELFLSFDGTYNLGSICDSLKVLCDRKHFRRLEIDLRFTTQGYNVTKMIKEHGHQLTTLQSLLGLHLFDFSDYGIKFLPTLSAMKNLRILQVDSVGHAQRLKKIQLDGFLSLEELHIGLLVDVKFAQKFICEVKSLNLISIQRCQFTISRLDVQMLNIERNKLLLGVNRVNELVIYVDVKAKKMKIDKVTDMNLVKIEFVNFEMNTCNFGNPFLKTSHTKVENN